MDAAYPFTSNATSPLMMEFYAKYGAKRPPLALAQAAGTLTAPYNPQLPPPPGVGMPPITDPRIEQMQEQQMVGQAPQQAPQVDQTAAISQFPKAEEGAEIPEENLWSATGKTDDFGSWFNKRNSSDALTAFGAAMLKAPDFMTGLGDAALAVNQVDRDNRIPTPEEIARANIKARMASGKGMGSSKVIQTGYDNNMNPVTQMTNPNGGPPIWYDSRNREMPDGPMNGFIRVQDSGAGQRGKDGEKLETIARDKSYAATDNMSTYNEILATAPNAGPSSGLLESSVRTMASLAGIDLGDADLSDMQVLNKNISNLELQKAQTQKGLGQFTEMERAIVRKSLPGIDTELETVLRVTTQMKLRDQLDIELYEEYMDMPDSVKPRDFEKYAYEKRREQRNEYKQRYEDLLQSETANNPAYEKYKATGSKKAEPSILDEADAIVN